MADRLQLLQEANKRGLLPPQMRSAFEEAQKRGLVGIGDSSSDLGIGGLPSDASPIAFAGQSAQAMEQGATSGPMEPSRNVGVGASMLEAEENMQAAAVQGTDPAATSLNKPLGPATVDDGGQVWFRDASGKDQLADRSRHVALSDPATGDLTVYERAPETDELGTLGTIKSFGRMILPGMLVGPVTGAAGRIRQSSAAIQRATRLSEAARDLEAFETLNIPTPGFAFGSGPMAASGKQLTEMPILGAPVRGQLEGAISGAAETAHTIAGGIGQASKDTEAGAVVSGAIQRGLEGTRDRVSGVADALSPTASHFDTGRALQAGVERVQTAGVAQLEPGVVEGLGIPARAQVPRPVTMSQGAAANAAEAAPIREQMGQDFLRRGGSVTSIPTETSRGVAVPSALPRDLTLATRTTAEMLDEPQLQALIRTPAARTSFAARAEALYENAWRMMAPMMKAETASGRVAANPNMVAAPNTRAALGQIDEGIANQIAGQGTVTGELAARLRNPHAGNFQMDDLRSIRTEVGRAIGRLNPLTATLDGSQLNQLYGAITRDMEVGFETLANRALIRSRLGNNQSNYVSSDVAVRAAGALRAFRTADRYYRAGQQRFERFGKIMKAQNPEVAAKTIVSATKGKGSGNTDLVRTAMAVLRPEERNEISSLVLREMGLPSASARGMEQTVGFSAQGFLKSWREMNPAVRNILFRDQQLSEINQALQEAERWDSVRSILNAEKPEAIFAAIKNMALAGGRGDIQKLGTVKSIMKADEWDDIRSAFIHSMGTPKPNTKGFIEKLGWSPTTFQTTYSAMSADAKRMFFTGTHQTALEDLFRVASRLADVEALANVSRSTSNAMGVMALISGAGRLASGDWLGLLLGPAVVGSASLLLTSPKYARWAVGYANLRANLLMAPGAAMRATNRAIIAPDRQLLTHINRLSVMARHNPDLLPVLRSISSENGIGEGSEKKSQVENDVRRPQR